MFLKRKPKLPWYCVRFGRRILPRRLEVQCGILLGVVAPILPAVIR